MSVRINDVNSYVVSELMGNNSNAYNSSPISILQNLGEKYAEISAFGAKLNDIYQTLAQSGNVSESALEGARNIIMSWVNSPNTNLNWMETVNNIDNLKNNPQLFTQLFTVANSISQNGFDLSGWLQAFNGASSYGFANDFIAQTDAIVKAENKQLASQVFSSFVNTLNNILSNSVNEGITRQSLTNLFSGLSNASNLEQKNSFLQSFAIV